MRASLLASTMWRILEMLEPRPLLLLLPRRRNLTSKLDLKVEGCPGADAPFGPQLEAEADTPLQLIEADPLPPPLSLLCRPWAPLAVAP